MLTVGKRSPPSGISFPPATRPSVTGNISSPILPAALALSSQDYLFPGPVQTELRREPHQPKKSYREPDKQQWRVQQGQQGGDNDLHSEERPGDEEVAHSQADAKRPNLAGPTLTTTRPEEQDIAQ